MSNKLRKMIALGLIASMALGASAMAEEAATEGATEAAAEAVQEREGEGGNMVYVTSPFGQ